MIGYNTRLLYMMKFFGAITMRCRLRMKAPADPEALNAAVQKTMTRYPYLAKKIAVRNGTYVLEENDLPVPVFKTGTPMPALGSKELNHHLISADYDGNDIYFTLLHNLGGGRGMFQWVSSVLYQYIWELTGKDPYLPDIRRPDLPPEPGEELIEPLLDLPEIKPLWEGFPDGTNPMSQTEIQELLKEDREEGTYITVFSTDEKKTMEKVKECGATPSVWFAALYYKALLRCLPEVPECMDMGITCDVSSQYGFSGSMSLITRFLHFIITKEEASLDIASLCRKGRAEIKLQKDPGVTNELLKKERDTLVRMEEYPSIQEKAAYYIKHSLIADMIPTALVSYVGRCDLKGTEDYLESAFFTGLNTTNGIVFTASDGRFQLGITHKYKDAGIAYAFEEELKEQGMEILSAERNIDQNNLKAELPDE